MHFARILLLTSWLGFSAAVHGSLVWHWDEPFTAAEQATLTTWLEQTHAAIERYAGPLPFPVHVHMAQSERGGEPVPWANTWRGEEQGIYFYVDTDYALEDFLADWTGAHEFSHLLLPYLGRENAWFAEGFASYLQYMIMVEMGVISAAEARRRRDDRISRALTALADEQAPLPENMPALRANGSYPTFYWGGAVYFERVDTRLQAEGSSLQTVLREFVACCRSGKRSLDELVASLDTAGRTSIFSEELTIMRREPGCPERMPASRTADEKKRG